MVAVPDEYALRLHHSALGSSWHPEEVEEMIGAARGNVDLQADVMLMLNRYGYLPPGYAVTRVRFWREADGLLGWADNAEITISRRGPPKPWKRIKGLSAEEAKRVWEHLYSRHDPATGQRLVQPGETLQDEESAFAELVEAGAVSEDDEVEVHAALFFVAGESQRAVAIYTRELDREANVGPVKASLLR